MRLNARFDLAMNILSIDLEEWYTYELFKKGPRSYYEPHLNYYLDLVLDRFEQNNIKATFYCLGIIARSHPEIINKIVSKGHEIGCHSDVHSFIGRMSPLEFENDTKKAIGSLEDVVGEKIVHYRAPAFSISEKTSWALEILINQGIQYDSSIFPSNRSFGGFPSFSESKPTIIETKSGSIKELPMNYANFAGNRIMFTGGGYFRLLPYPLIKKMMNESDYNMSYFHLRDFDEHQKKVYNLRYLKSYYGIKGAFAKFEKYTQDFKFISVGDAVEQIDWEKCNSFVL